MHTFQITGLTIDILLLFRYNCLLNKKGLTDILRKSSILRDFKIKYINRINNLSAAKKSALAFLVASFIQQSFSFIITPIFTRILSTEEFGLVITYNSWLDIIGTVSMLSLASGVFGVGMMDFEENRDRFITGLLGVSNIATFVTMIVVFCINEYNPAIFNIPRSLLLLMFIYYIFYPAMRFWSARQRFEYKYKYLSIVTILCTLMAPIFALTLIYSIDFNRGMLRLFGTNGVLIFFGICCYINIIRKDHHLFDFKIWKYSFLFALPLLPHYLSMYILSASDRIMISNIIGIQEAAFYGLAYTASMVVSIFWTAIQGSMTPYVYRQLKQGSIEKISPVVMPCLYIFIIISFAIILIAPEIMEILGGEKYNESIILMPVLITSVLFMQMYNLFSMIEFYYKQTKRIMLATFAAAICNIFLNYIFLPLYGYIAAAYTTLICYILYCAFHYYNMVKIEPRKIYNLKHLLFISIIYIILGNATVYIYDYKILRFSIFLFTIYTFLSNFNKFIHIYKQVKGNNTVLSS